jgi:hypothetical protein
VRVVPNVPRCDVAGARQETYATSHLGGVPFEPLSRSRVICARSTDSNPDWFILWDELYAFYKQFVGVIVHDVQNGF